MAMRRAMLAAITIGVCMGAVAALPARAQTQFEMNQEAGARLKSAEAELAHVLDQLRAKATGKAKALEKLGDDQSAWERYRDTQLGVLWPFLDSGAYGSVTPM